MSFDASGAAAAALPPPTQLQAGYGAGLGGGQPFEHAMQAAEAGSPTSGASGAQQLSGAPPAGSVDPLRPAMQGMLSSLESVNGEANQLAQAANAAKSKGAQLTPGEMVMLSVRCQEFMFHCQLTSNIANRTSDGLQQLFRQQG